MNKCFICQKEFNEKDDLKRLLLLQKHLIQEHNVFRSLDDLMMIWKKEELMSDEYRRFGANHKN